MSVHSLKRWHWLLLGIVLGLVLGVGREWTLRDLSHYGESLNGFEDLRRSLARTASDAPVIRNVRVHRQVLESRDARQTVHLVCGEYRDARSDPAGRISWHPFVFVAGIPFRPAGTSPEAQALQESASPTVLDFLAAMKLKYGLRYTNAWWDTYPRTTWLLAATLIVGVLCPTLIDLWFYGRLIRPAEPKGIDLSRLRQPQDSAAAQEPVPTSSGLESMELDVGQLLTIPPEAPATASPPPIIALCATAAEPALPMSEETAPREFAARKDDYYPTARTFKPPQANQVAAPAAERADAENHRQ